MDIHEHTVVLIAKERMGDAWRHAEQMRTLRLARVPRPPARVRLGTVLIRLGHWIQGQPPPAPRTAIDLRQVQS